MLVCRRTLPDQTLVVENLNLVLIPLLDLEHELEVTDRAIR